MLCRLSDMHSSLLADLENCRHAVKSEWCSLALLCGNCLDDFCGTVKGRGHDPKDMSWLTDTPDASKLQTCLRHLYHAFVHYILDVDYMITNVSTCECTDLKHREGEKQIYDDLGLGHSTLAWFPWFHMIPFIQWCRTRCIARSAPSCRKQQPHFLPWMRSERDLAAKAIGPQLHRESFDMKGSLGHDSFGFVYVLWSCWKIWLLGPARKCVGSQNTNMVQVSLTMRSFMIF